jgi:hypothetical protein
VPNPDRDINRTLSGGLTLHGLANALRGMPRGAPILLWMPDGSLRGVAVVRPVLLGGGGEALGKQARAGVYAIILEPDGG